MNNKIENQQNILTNLRRAESVGNISMKSFKNKKKPINSIPLRSNNTCRLSTPKIPKQKNYKFCNNSLPHCSTEQFAFINLKKKCFNLKIKKITNI